MRKTVLMVHRNLIVLVAINCNSAVHNRADSFVYSNSFSHTLSEPTGNIHESNCKKCSEYESQLCEVLNELGSARKIIEILQKELSILYIRQQTTRAEMS